MNPITRIRKAFHAVLGRITKAIAEEGQHEDGQPL